MFRYRSQALRRTQGGKARRSGVKSRSGSSFKGRTTQIASRFGRGKQGYAAARFQLGRGLPTLTADRYRTTLKYSLILNTSIVSGVSSPYVFRGNSVYDPDFTSTGYNCLGFSTLALLYQRYQVTGSSIRVRASTSAGPGVQLSVLPSLFSATVSSTSEDYAENPYGKDVLTNAYMPPELRSYMSTSKMYGDKVLDANYSAGIAANPTNEWFWQVKCSPMDIGTTSTVYVLVDLVYYVEFSRRFAYSTRV